MSQMCRQQQTFPLFIQSPRRRGPSSTDAVRIRPSALARDSRLVHRLGNLRARQVSLTRVPGNREDAGQLLGAVEQRPKLRTRALNDKLPNAVEPLAAHLISGPLHAIYAIEVGLGCRINQLFILLRRGQSEDVLDLNLERLAVRARNCHDSSIVPAPAGAGGA